MPWMRPPRTCRGRQLTAIRRTTSELQTKDKVRFYRTPDSVLQKQLEIFDQVEAKKSAEVPMFKEIADSQRAFAARAVKWDLDTNVNRRMAYNHYFAKTATKKS